MPTLDEISDAIRAGDMPLHLAIQLDPATLSAIWNATRDPKELFRLIMWTCSAHTVIHQIIIPMTRRIVSDSADVGPWARPVLQHLEQALAEPNRREFRRRLTSDLGVIQRQDQMGTRPLARVLSVAKVAVERYLDDGSLTDFAVVAPGRMSAAEPGTDRFGHVVTQGAARLLHFGREDTAVYGRGFTWPARLRSLQEPAGA